MGHQRHTVVPNGLLGYHKWQTCLRNDAVSGTESANSRGLVLWEAARCRWYNLERRLDLLDLQASHSAWDYERSCYRHKHNEERETAYRRQEICASTSAPRKERYHFPKKVLSR